MLSALTHDKAEKSFDISISIITAAVTITQRSKHKCRTSREPVPNFQPVVLAVSVSTWQGIVLQVKGEEGEGDIHSGRDNDDEGALEVVGVFVGKSRGLDEARGTGKVTGTV